jgi:hypothetical protein
MVQGVALGLEVLDRAARHARSIRKLALRPVDQSAGGPTLSRQENFCVRHLAHQDIVAHIG